MHKTDCLNLLFLFLLFVIYLCAKCWIWIGWCWGAFWQLMSCSNRPAELHSDSLCLKGFSSSPLLFFLISPFWRIKTIIFILMYKAFIFFWSHEREREKKKKPKQWDFRKKSVKVERKPTLSSGVARLLYISTQEKLIISSKLPKEITSRENNVFVSVSHCHSKTSNK